MTETNGWLLAVLVAGMVGGAVAGFIGTSFIWAGLVDWHHARSTLFESRYEYCFRGANERGYLELCPEAGEPGVRFRDEC